MEKAPENKLGTMPIGKLLLNVSLPIVLSMLVQALYNIVDSIFVAQVSEDALTAVSLAFPIQNLMIAFAVGTSVGVASLLSRRLGERDYAAANRAATNGLFLGIVTWVAFAALGILGTDAFFSSYANNPEVGQEIADMGATYMRIVTIASFGMFNSVMCERLLQSTGRSTLSMVTQMVGAVVNIILDPIFIFGWLGLPAMGVAGAAIATVIGQFVAMFLGIYFNVSRNREIKIQFKGFRPNSKTIKHIYQVGLPTIIMQSIGSLMTFAMNTILVAFGTTPVSVFGVYFKLQSFVFMPVFGFNSGMVPIIAYNFGARKPDRIRETVKMALAFCFTVMVVGTILFWAIPGLMLRMFDADEQMMEIGVKALRYISLAFPMASVSIIFSGFFQALGEGVYSLILSVVRQLVFLIPSAWLLARFYGLDAVWFSFPISEIAALILVIFLFRRAWRRRITNGIAAGPAPAQKAAVEA